MPSNFAARTFRPPDSSISRPSKNAASTPSATKAIGPPAKPTSAVRKQTAPGVAEHYLRALDIKTGKTVWELTQPGPAQGWGGTIATATGIIFFGEENGAMMAADAATGKPRWRFETNQNWKASPMAYMFDGKQYIAGIAGGNVLAFGLPD